MEKQLTLPNIREIVKECFLCGATEEVEEHHLDWNHKNKTRNNRIHLCRKCHVWIHSIAGYLNLDELKKIKKELAQEARLALLRVLRSRIDAVLSS